MVPERDPAQLGLGKRGTRSDFSKDALSSTQSRSSHRANLMTNFGFLQNIVL